MGEVKQTNFRIDQETADIFRKFCEDNGMSQAQGFDHVMQVVEMDRAKAAAPTRITEIESFEKSVKDIMSAYLYSIEINQTAEGRIREQFISDLNRKDKTIDDLRTKEEQLQAEKDAAEATAAEAVKAKNQAEKDAEAAKEQAETTNRLAQEKDRTIATLAEKLGGAESKLDGYDELVSKNADAQEQIKELNRTVSDLKKEHAAEIRGLTEKYDKQLADEKKDHAAELRDLTATLERKALDAAKDYEAQISGLKASLERQISEAEKDAELAVTKAVTEKEREMTALIREAEKEIARLQARIEVMETRNS